MRSTLSPFMLLLVFAAPAFAEDIYRSTMPDGRIVYGESPFPGAKSVRKVAPPPVTTGTFIVTTDEKARGLSYNPNREGGVAILPAERRDVAPVTGVGQLQSLPGQLPKRPY